MNILSRITNFVTGGSNSIAVKLLDMIDKRWPKKLNDQEKAELQLMLGEATHAQQIELLKIGTQEQLRFDERIMSLEGTASDLKAAGWPGRLVLFLRGAQRPAWGFFTLYMDFNGILNCPKAQTPPPA